MTTRPAPPRRRVGLAALSRLSQAVAWGILFGRLTLGDTRFGAFTLWVLMMGFKTLRKVSTVIAFQLYRAVEDWSASCPPGGRVPAWLEGRAYDPRFPVGDELWK